MQAPRWLDPGRQVAGAPPDGRVGVVADRGLDDRRIERTGSGERTERHVAEPRVEGAERAPGGRLVPPPAGEHHVDQAERLFRGRIVAHRPSMSEPDSHRTTPQGPPPRPADAPVAPAVPTTGGGATPASPRRARRWPRVLLLVVAALVVAAAIADHVELDYYVVTPGVARPVSPLVKVPAARTRRERGRVLLTDVYITRVNALTYVYDKLRGDSQMLPASTVLGPATPPSQLVAQGYLEMQQSQSAAKAAAFTRLGYHVAARDTGVVVFAVVPGSPASRLLRVGQVVTSVDASPTKSACAFSLALAGRRPGQVVHLRVEQSHVTARAEIARGPTVDESVRLGKWPSSVPHPAATPACPGTGWHGQGFLGIEAESQQAFSFPFPVTVETTSIGGPSAGLAMTLGIVDALSGGNLTGGRSIAATGTITPTGSIGAVGGVPEKTVAVERAGATVFFVPASQVATARAEATPSLAVYGVRNLTQVLGALRRLGGTIPPSVRHGS